MKKNLFCLVVIALTAVGCATHQVRFDTWKGVPEAELANLKNGTFHVPKAKLFDAVAITLEHEPYLHWSLDELDHEDGLIKASAGLFREVQVRVADAEGGLSKMAVNVPRRELKTRAKIWVKNADANSRTAYEPAADQLDQYHVISADVELDGDYFVAFTYHALNDRNQVPFKLEAYENDLDAPAKPAPTPVPVNGGAPVRADPPAPTPTATPQP